LGNERPVVFYDQLGWGRSGRSEDMSLWNIDRFVEELDLVREQLALERFHLYGHSWGAMLALRYVEEKGSKGIASLILGGPLLSTPHWIADAESLRSVLPDSIQAVLRRHENAGTTDSDSYLAATEVFYDRFLFHHQPRVEIPECDGMDFFNPVIYGYMWGPTEFCATGTLREYDVSGFLTELALPVLFVIGRYDEARPETVKRYAEMTAVSRVEIIEGTAHAAMNEEPERYVSLLRDFIYDAERGAVK
jgi:proline iminopeptidase